MKSISVVIPTYNEADNITELIERIGASLRNLTYEIIVIDDHSEDDTYAIAAELATRFPVKLLKKRGKRGKAYSLLEGFAKARYEIIAMIDGDLQYPPEEILSMANEIYVGDADIVVANRNDARTGIARIVASGVFKTAIGRLLWGFHVDVQSGLKVFRRSILKRIDVTPDNGWVFDLEFLVQARDAGMIIEGHDITFESRKAGQTKVKLMTDAPKIASSAVKLKFTRNAVIRFDDSQMEEKGEGFHFKGDEYVPHNNLDHKEISLMRALPLQKITVIIVLVAFVVALMLDWVATLIIVIAAMMILYFADLLFNLNLITRSLRSNPETRVSRKDLKSIPAGDFPIYTILCPLYNESDVLPQFIAAMRKIDYDTNKLQIILLLEENDTVTQDAVKQLNLRKHFETVVVPHSMPKTKPKACNYGLKFARGEFIVIYDAEDIPDPKQLKKAYATFRRSDKRVVCVQCKLNFYNPHQNILTRAFAAEYSLWFDLILTGMQHMNAPIPLGGTSNHFRTADLRRLGGWDAFNVTEDADLGMRIAQRGLSTAVLDSTTMEEANSTLKNWFWQRTRWIKGYLQTFFVHSRDFRMFRKSSGRRMTGVYFQLIIGGKVLAALINPIMWLLTILYFVTRPVSDALYQTLFPTPVLYLGVISMLFGNFLFMYYYVIGCVKRGHYGLVKYAIFAPIYWLGISAAAYYAVAEFIYKPHKWRKTRHGVHLRNDHAGKPAGTHA